MKKIKRQKLFEIFPQVSNKYLLFLPLKEDGVVNFKVYDGSAEIDLDALNTVRPPKEIFFPPWENYLKFRSKNETLELEVMEEEKEKEFLLFGVRPCDEAGFSILDKVFLEDPQDPLYLSRREKTVIVAHACSEPAPTCFCASFKLDPVKSPGADLLMYDMEEDYLFLPQTAKGEKLLQELDVVLEEASQEEEDILKNNCQESSARVAANVNNYDWKAEGLVDFFEDKFEWSFWDNLYRRCLGCGTCTFLCPTCHCFDVQDFAKGQDGLRFRCWDSCMYGDFTLMASGENPRPSQKERVRNRFLHKLHYYPSRYDGIYACVGCGRCTRKCPVQLDITQVMKKAGGEINGNG